MIKILKKILKKVFKKRSKWQKETLKLKKRFNSLPKECTKDFFEKNELVFKELNISPSVYFIATKRFFKFIKY